MRGLSRMHLISGLVGPQCGAEVMSEEAARGAGRPSTVRPLCPHSEALAVCHVPGQGRPRTETQQLQKMKGTRVLSRPLRSVETQTEHVSLIDV